MTVYEWIDGWVPTAVNSDPIVKAKTIYLPGWEHRGRPGSFFPSGIVDHHTACMLRLGHDPQADINVVLAGNSVAPGPIAQFLLTLTAPGTKWNGFNADPHLIVVAAGRCNHAGATEYPWGAPGGNGSTIGNEACGPPAEGWPPEYIEFRARWSAALLRTTGWPLSHLVTHHQVAVPLGRKIDPSGAWLLEPALPQLKPWSDDLWRSYVNRFLIVPSPGMPSQPVPIPPIVQPQPTTGEEEMSYEIMDYGVRPNTSFVEDQGKAADWWWTEFGFTTRGLCWSGAPANVDVPSNVYHVMAELTGKKPLRRIQSDAEMKQWIERLGTTGPVPDTFHLNPDLTAYWQQHSND